jgi:TIR domain-containing protein/WD40 domain-containing protein
MVVRPGETSHDVTAMLKAFISYSHTDHAQTHLVEEYLTYLGFDVWTDDRMAPGADIGQAVGERIAECDAFVIGLSPISVRSPWVMDHERRIAQARELQSPRRRPKILPILVKPMAPEDLPPVFWGLHYVDMTSASAHVWKHGIRQYVETYFAELELPQDECAESGAGQSDRSEALKIVGRPERPEPDQLLVFRHPSQVRDLAFSPDGKTLATVSDDDHARLWDLTGEGTKPRRIGHGSLGRHAHGLLAVAFHPDGQTIATGGHDNTARVRVPGQRRDLMRVDHDGSVRDVAFSPDGHCLATASADRSARITRISDDHLVLNVAWAAPMTAVAFSADGKRLAIAAEDGWAWVREIDADADEWLLKAKHPSAVWDVTFSPDGESIATACDDGSARTWEIANGRETSVPHDVRVWSVALNPSGSRLATAGEDVSAWEWDRAHGSAARRFRHDDLVWAVAYSPAGDRLASASADRTARVWRL